jgi:hypothetical protein
MPGEDVPVVWEVGTSKDLTTTVASVSPPPRPTTPTPSTST